AGASTNTSGARGQPVPSSAMNDRVRWGGFVLVALSVSRGRGGQAAPATRALWAPLPMTACGQLAQFCQGNSNPNAVTCLTQGQAGNETTCRTRIEPCLSYCQPQQAAPCSGLCNNPVRFSVSNNGHFSSGNLGTGEVCFETKSTLFLGNSRNFVAPRVRTVNGRPEPLNGNWNYPLPPQRNGGYCIQAPPGDPSFAAFTANSG